ncbi:MAG: hypothetical protein ACLR4Z_06805 [Butyricicoccaceae bacterium]
MRRTSHYHHFIHGRKVMSCHRGTFANSPNTQIKVRPQYQDNTPPCYKAYIFYLVTLALRRPMGSSNLVQRGADQWPLTEHFKVTKRDLP